MSRPTTAVIIPTLNRPDDLRNCIASILKQSRLPDEVIVVDDGELEFVPFQAEMVAAGISCRYHRKTSRGLTASRNIGIGMTTCDLLFFLDDDVVLFDNYIAAILDAFDALGERIMGVGGIIANTEPVTVTHRLRRLLDRCFLVTGAREGRVLPSGFSTDYGSTGRPLPGIVDVDFLPGGVSAWRRELFAEYSFSEAYRGYGMGEDKDFSYRVSRRYRLVVNPAARLYHYESPNMRLDRARETREIVMGRYHLFRDHVKTRTWQWGAFYYALIGYLLGRVVIAIISPKRRNWQRVRGILMAIRDIICRRATIG